MHVGELSEPTKTMIAAPQSALIATTALPFLTSYYGAHQSAENSSITGRPAATLAATAAAS